MLPVWASVLMALVTAASGIGVDRIVRWWLERGREPALIAKLTEEANRQIYASYGDLIGQLRQDAAIAREEGRSARAEAQEATLRASAAEARAAGAEARAARAEAAFGEMRALVRQHVPEADEVLRGLERLLNGRAPNDSRRS